MNNKLSQRLNQLYNSNKLPWIIIFVGIVLRLVRYLYNPSFWFDESVVAEDIISRSFSDLINPSPDWSSKYPYGFLIITKFATQVFGNSEYALRLFPLIFGIVSLFLFYNIAKYYLSPNAVLIALGLFAIVDPLIYYSSELKPYSSDLTFALLIFILSIYIQSKKLNVPRIVLFVISGAIVIWFSHPSVFVLAGAGLSLAVYSFNRKEWSRLWGLSTVYAIWALSFIANYLIYIRRLFTNLDMSVEENLKFMEKAFMPIPPKSLADFKWYIDLFFGIFNDPVGLTLAGLGAVTFLIGCILIFSENKEKFLFLISPVIFTLLASALHKYAFVNRLIAFLVPFILFFIAEGAEYIREKISVKSIVSGVIFVGLLFSHPMLWAVYHAKAPSSAEEIRPVMSYIKNHWQNGDVLYVHYYAQYAFEYYSKYHPRPYNFNEKDYVVGIAPRGWYRTWRKQQVSKYYNPDQAIKQSSTDILNEYIKDVDKLRGRKRVWILFTSIIVKDGMQEENFFLFHLETIGKRLDSFGRTGIAAVYLYDLSEQTSKRSE